MFGSKRLKHLDRTIDVASEIWNHSVALKNRYYKMFGKGLAKPKLQSHLAKLRRTRFPHWKSVDSQSVQAITDRLYLGWEAFFKGDIKRPPTFRKRRKYRSFTLKQSGYKVLGLGRIKVLGRNYRFNQSRPITGIVKTVTVRRDPERVIGFFNAYREGKRVTRNCLRDIAEQFQNWVKNRCQKWGTPILDAPEGRRDDFVDPYFKPRKMT